jgi:hypothetical protein
LAGQRLAAGLLDELDGLIARRDIGDNDVHAVFRQALGERLPDAVRCAGDDGNLVLVAFGHCVFPD